MVRAWFFPNVPLLILYFFMCCSTSEANMQIKKAVENGSFRDKKIIETFMKAIVVTSKIDCIFACILAPTCLSFSFNKDLRVCHLFDKDFVKVAEIQTADDIGWQYYYVLPVGVIDKSLCELPTTGICQSFCFFYELPSPLNRVQHMTKACSDGGGEVIKVDRYLKQYCMEQAVDLATDLATSIWDVHFGIDGLQDENTGEWTYFDGTSITYFYWDVYYWDPQPNYVSPSNYTLGYEGYLGTQKSFSYRWHDAPLDWMNGVLCEIK